MCKAAEIKNVGHQEKNNREKNVKRYL